MALVNQPTAAPTRKVSAVAVSGALLTVLMLIAQLTGWNLPEDVAKDLIDKGIAAYTAVITLVLFVSAYFTKNRDTDQGL